MQLNRWTSPPIPRRQRVETAGETAGMAPIAGEVAPCSASSGDPAQLRLTRPHERDGWTRN